MILECVTSIPCSQHFVLNFCISAVIVVVHLQGCEQMNTLSAYETEVVFLVNIFLFLFYMVI
jgi:hypothetical protein